MKYKILLVSHSSEVSGAPRVLLDIAGCLSPENYDLTLCIPEPGGIAEQAEKNELPVKIIPNPQVGFLQEKNPLKKLKILYQRLCFIRNLRREIKKTAYDLVYVNSSASFYAGLALFCLKTKIIWHIHENLPPTFINRIKCRLIVKLSHRIVFVSPSNLPCFHSFLSENKYQILPNGIDSEKMKRFSVDKEYNQRFDFKTGDQIVAMICFLSRLKGLDIFLKALKLILPEYPSVKGVIAGDKSGADPLFLEEIEALCESPELKGRIYFPGHCMNIPSLLDVTTVFVLSSRNEAMPLVILEAMVAGKAIVAADVGCVREMLDPPHAGLVVPPENPEALAGEIRKLLNDPERRIQLGRTARERVRKYYSMETFCKKINLLIKNALEKIPPSS
jgi:glycosyltransferase involved in cell wall biosynthesis